MPVQLLEHIVCRRALPGGCTRIAPIAALQNVVEGLYVWQQPGKPAAQFIFNDGTPSLLCLLTATGTVQQVWICGSYLEKQYLPAIPGTTLLVMRFTPAGAAAVLNVPPHTLRNYIGTLEEVLPSSTAAALLHQLNQAAGIPAQLNLLQHFAVQQYQPQNGGNALFYRAAALIQRGHGNSTITGLCKQLNVSSKTLERYFLRYTGITPKEYVRMQRFIHAHAHLSQTGGRDIMGTAVHHGYYDQNHFTKEFKLFTGTAPLAYLKSMQPQGA